MIVISSLSPSHANKDVQEECIRSWQKYGDVVCLQTKSEIMLLNKMYTGVNFVECYRTTKHILKKELVLISEFINFAKEAQDDLLIINSDIMLSQNPVIF